MAKRGSDVEQNIDALYEAAPAAFTEARDALAKRLKAEGNAAESARVKALRKPTAIAYLLNQLARRHPDELAELVDVGRVLARAQRKALRGEAGHDLRDAITRQRAVVTSLTTQTAAVMKELGLAAGHLDAIAAALQAALVDPAVGEQLEEGRLEKVPGAAAGFPGASAAPTRDHEPEPRKQRAAPSAGAALHEKASASTQTHARAGARERAKAQKQARAEARAQEQTERRAQLAALDARAAELEGKAKTAVAAAAEAKRAANIAAMTASAALAAAKRARRQAGIAR